jgi:hypothetical protein
MVGCAVPGVLDSHPKRVTKNFYADERCKLVIKKW